MTEEKGKYTPGSIEEYERSQPQPGWKTPVIMHRNIEAEVKELENARNHFVEADKMMYHGINSGLFLYGSAWTSAIVMIWCLFLGVVQPGTVQWVLIGIMILVGILNYPARETLPKIPKKEVTKDE